MTAPKWEAGWRRPFKSYDLAITLDRSRARGRLHHFTYFMDSCEEVLSVAVNEALAREKIAIRMKLTELIFNSTSTHETTLHPLTHWHHPRHHGSATHAGFRLDLSGNFKLSQRVTPPGTMKALPHTVGSKKRYTPLSLSFGLLDSACSAFRGDPGETHTPTATLLALPFSGSAIPEEERTVSVEIIILIIVLLLLFGGGGFYVYRGG